MPLYLTHQDITTMKTDAIVNAANESLLGGGGVDGAIHRAAGPELLEACRPLGGCRPGEAKRTLGYRLPAKYIIHTVGPRWRGGREGEEETLRACYRNSLLLAQESGCESVAFPLISSGIFGYPKEEALDIAQEEIRRFLQTEDMTVYLILFGREPLDRYRFPELRRQLEALEAEKESAVAPDFLASMVGNAPMAPGSSASIVEEREELLPQLRPAPLPSPAATRPAKEKKTLISPRRKRESLPQAEKAAAQAPQSLEEALRYLDESFSQMLLRKITEKGMTDAECYKKANIDRKLFSKIRSDAHYRPSKPTALAFAAALELPLPEVRELLGKAGFALSRSSAFDVIVEYFFSRGEYDIFRINEALFAFDQALLGN